MKRILANDEIGQPFNKLDDGQRCLRKIGAALTPPDLSVLGRDLDEADGAGVVVIRRFRVGKRDRLNVSDAVLSHPECRPASGGRGPRFPVPPRRLASDSAAG